MVRSAELLVEPGDTFELWARARGSAAAGGVPFAFRLGDRQLYQIAHLPPYFEHFAWTAYAAETIELAWDPETIEVTHFYRFNPKTVARDGTTFLTLSDGGVKVWGADRWAEWYAAEDGRPTLRFSPFRGWMNDPNGLCKVGDSYHLFYQFHPNGTDWGPMHWGHAISPDLYSWKHLPVFLHPQQNLSSLGATGGAFSGNAFFDRNNELSFYYTERLPAYDLVKDYKEIQRRMTPSSDLLGPTTNQVVLTAGGPGTAHDVRDPKVWFDEDAGLYRMVLGAAVDGDPAILLHNSHDGFTWEFDSVLYRAPKRFREGGARCAECPDFFRLDGHWVLVAGFVGYTEAETGRHNLLYAIVGAFEDGVFKPHSDELQELDFGTDYYAMQSFWDGERQLAVAWLFNWEFRKPEGSAYSGEMSLPRLLSIKSSKLLMQPEPGYRRWRDSSLAVGAESVTMPPNGEAIELSLSGDLSGLCVRGQSYNGAEFELEERDGHLHLRVPEDAQGSITYRSASLSLTQVTLFYDRGVLEVFANSGEVCGTRRTYKLGALASLLVKTKSGAIAAEAWSLNSVWQAP